jgi:2'-5' RNA ligase
VELIFDTQLTERVRRVWQNLTVEHIPHKQHPPEDLPHISLAICATMENIIEQFGDLAPKLSPFHVTFSSIGMFLIPRGLEHPTESVVLFLSPKPTSYLLDANRLAAKELPGWNRDRWEIYHPENWVPHCTVAEHLAPEDVLKALTICKNTLCNDTQNWPLTGRIQGARLINFGDPGQQELARHLFPDPSVRG